jgi:predicted NAD/FAD-binding protein
LNPRLYRMVFDVLRFNLFCLDILKEENTDDMSIGEYLDREGYGDGFKEDYLLVSWLIW